MIICTYLTAAEYKYEWRGVGTFWWEEGVSGVEIIALTLRAFTSLDRFVTVFFSVASCASSISIEGSEMDLKS